MSFRLTSRHYNDIISKKRTAVGTFISINTVYWQGYHVMSTFEPLYNIIGAPLERLSKLEKYLLEAEILFQICKELQEIYHSQNKDYFNLLKFNPDKENTMIEDSFIRCVIKDILVSEEYSLEGIAYHTHIPEDVICDVVVGKNTTPSLQVSQKLIELHRTIRPDIYQEIIKKIAGESNLTPTTVK